MYRIIQNLCIVFIVLFTSGCGSNKAKKAQVKISKYTLEQSEKPTIEDYKTAGISEISESNIDKVNELLIEMPADDVDTFEEIKVVIDVLLDNEIPPEIAILGANPITFTLDSTYEELGAVASDDRDGNLTKSIRIVSEVKNDQIGSYTVRYFVEDSAGNEVNTTRQVNIVIAHVNTGTSDNNATVEPETPVTIDGKIIIEDAEDGKIERWGILYSHSDKAEISNIDDDAKGNKVIFMDGAVLENGIIQTVFQYKRTIKNTTSRIIQWSMKTNKNFFVRFMVATKNGMRYLEYYPKDTGKGLSEYKNQKKINYGIGSNATDNTWHTFARDLDIDIKRYESDNGFISIKDIQFGGSIKLDDLAFYSSATNLKIDKSVVVSAPGIVLTFDDSFIESWNSVIPMFRKNGVVATFFCHRWGSLQKGDITSAEVSKLKLFEADGHEIGYHTMEHIGAGDPMYDSYNTIEEKAQAYFSGQIEPGVEIMRKKGFDPESFSYPYVSGQPEHNKIIRETLPHIREFFAHVYMIDEKLKYSIDTQKLEGYLDKLKKDKEIGVFVGHYVVESESFTSTNKSHKVTKKRLERLIKYADKIGLKFYTLEEAHRIYINQ